MASDTPQSNNCPSCGHATAPDYRFCSECGFNLATKACPSCHAPNEAEAKFCTDCGSLLTDEATGGETTDVPPIEAPVPAEVTSSTAPPEPAPRVDDPPPTGSEPPLAPELLDIRAPIPESLAGEPMPFEPRRVPAEGMAAWTQPDADTQPETHLGGGTDLLLIEKNGAWAHVLSENGWKGWVDDRLLVDPDLIAPPGGPVGSIATTAPAQVPSTDSTVVMPATVPPHPSASPNMAGLIKRPLTIAGAAAAIVAIFLPWSSSTSGINGFDVPVAMLFDVSTDGSDFSVGLVLLALGAFSAAIVLVPRFSKLSNLLIPVGIGIIGAGGLFLYQMSRLEFVPFREVLAAGPIVTVAAGVLVLTRR